MLTACRQAKVKGWREKEMPKVLRIEALEIIEVPAVFAVSHPDVLYYGNEQGVSATAKRLWSSTDKESLPDPLYAPPFPRSSGSKVPWQSLKEAFVDEYNEGGMRDGVLVKKWPEEGQPLFVWPALKVMVSNFKAVAGSMPYVIVFVDLARHCSML